MAERAFYHSWQIKRVMRAQWARLSFRAHTKCEDDENRVEQEVAELGLRLFRRPTARPDCARGRGGWRGLQGVGGEL